MKKEEDVKKYIKTFIKELENEDVQVLKILNNASDKFKVETNFGTIKINNSHFITFTHSLNDECAPEFKKVQKSPFWKPDKDFKGAIYYIDRNNEVNNIIMSNTSYPEIVFDNPEYPKTLDTIFFETEEEAKELNEYIMKMAKLKAYAIQRNKLTGRKVDFKRNQENDTKDQESYYRIYYNHQDKYFKIDSNSYIDNLTPYFILRSDAERAIQLFFDEDFKDE